MTASFRETLWFKRGELVEGGEEAAVPLPIEDRYRDDGTVFATDSMQFGLHSGETRRIAIESEYVSIHVVSLDTDVAKLARELRKGPARTFAAAVCASVCAVVAVVAGVL